MTRDYCKFLYKKYSNLENPELIREVINKELEVNTLNKYKRIISTYPKHKRSLLLAIQENKSMIFDAESIIQVQNKIGLDEFVSVSYRRLYILQNELRELMGRLDLLECEYRWAKVYVEVWEVNNCHRAE